MGFEKKILVLREVESIESSGKRQSGIFRIEIDEGVATVFLSVINLVATLGEYRFIFIDGRNKQYCYSLGKRPSSQAITLDDAPDIKNGIAVALYSVIDDLPTLIMFQRSEGCLLDIIDLKKIIAERCAKNRKIRIDEDFSGKVIKESEETPKREENISSETQVVEDVPCKEKTEREKDFNEGGILSDDVVNKYDDEAVATENYYDLDENIEKKLRYIEGLSDGEYGVCDKNGDGNIGNENEKPQGGEDRRGKQNEENFNFGEKYSAGNPYYETVKDELNEVLNKFPEEEQLCKMFSGSKFVRISYSEGKYYVVGVVKEWGKEKYICYGVPSEYSSKPPKQLEGYSSFVPKSIFNLRGDGYFMMFQDAITGECVHFNG